jgi:hypothetical protein
MRLFVKVGRYRIIVSLVRVKEVVEKGQGNLFSLFYDVDSFSSCSTKKNQLSCFDLNLK